MRGLVNEKEVRASLIVGGGSVLPKVRVQRADRPSSMVPKKRSSEHFDRKFSMTAALGQTLAAIAQIAESMQEINELAGDKQD